MRGPHPPTHTPNNPGRLIAFYYRPTGAHPLAKYLAALDSKFNDLFMDTGWRELFGRVESPSLGTADL